MNWWNDDKICLVVDCVLMFASAIAGIVGSVMSEAWLACGGWFVFGATTMALALRAGHN